MLSSVCVSETSAASVCEHSEDLSELDESRPLINSVWLTSRLHKKTIVGKHQILDCRIVTSVRYTNISKFFSFVILFHVCDYH